MMVTKTDIVLFTSWKNYKFPTSNTLYFIINSNKAKKSYYYFIGAHPEKAKILCRSAVLICGINK